MVTRGMIDPVALARRLSIPEHALEARGRGVVKVDPSLVEGTPRGRVVLVTAMTPTPAGEGKTTTTIGLVDGLNRRGVRAVGALREPSLGPLFGMKGGAVGGGKSRVEPAESINLHFTGDIHAVTSAHNLLTALVENHVFHDHAPRIEKITWGRVLDMNDRGLRQVQVGLAKGATAANREPHRSRFDITAASEVMAILCCSVSFEDLRARLDRIVVGTTAEGKAVTARDIDAAGAMAALLVDAARPNLVSSMEGSPFLIHGGPFANVAQGTSSLIGTNLARRVGDVVVTEAGFAFDLGGFKFCDIKCRAGGFRPAATVLVCTIRAMKFHGGGDIEKGIENIQAHVESMGRLGLAKPILAINKFPDDTASDLLMVEERARTWGVRAVEGTYFRDGAEGALALADAVKDELAKSRDDNAGYKGAYADADPLPKKIEGVARTVLGATGVQLTEQAQADLVALEKMELAHLNVCLAKTHLSISDDANVKGKPPPFVLKVTGLRASAGAGFIVALCGPILTMPGLPKDPAASRIDIERGPDGAYRVKGLA
jgi:formate--tetrahydrofolate ligase